MRGGRSLGRAAHHGGVGDGGWGVTTCVLLRPPFQGAGEDVSLVGEIIKHVEDLDGVQERVEGGLGCGGVSGERCRSLCVRRAQPPTGGPVHLGPGVFTNLPNPLDELHRDGGRGAVLGKAWGRAW